MNEILNEFMEPVSRLESDLIRAIKAKKLSISGSDIRYIVDLYYSLQKLRVALGNKTFSAQDEPTELTRWFETQFLVLENQAKRALAAWVKTDPVASWASSMVGVGPISAAAFRAMIDIKRAPHPASLWRFAGLDPTLEWKPGEKRPYNARLKVVCWRLGDVFVKLSNNSGSYYGAVYKGRKAYELARDASGKNAPTAKKMLEEKRKFSKENLALLKEGHLPKFILDWRARRYAVKRFLAHYWEVAYREEYKKDPPPPYVVEKLGHTHIEDAEYAINFEREARYAKSQAV